MHRGLHGTAWTVFEGTAPEPMDVEILGVLHNAIGPHQDMILARLHGQKPEYTGVVAGMSGSPVYIDGKLAGALAYRIGVFSKEPICGITPIEQMLQVRDEVSEETMQVAEARAGAPVASEAVAAGVSRRETGDASLAALVPGASLIRPIDTPLIFSGFAPEALQLWKEHAPDLGLMPVAGIGGAGSEADDAASAGDPVIPGSAVSAILVRGDLDIAATCTVTYVDAKHLLACGHPITQFGPVSMPMTRADVVATLPSEYNAFKIVNTTSTIGSFTQDRETAIMGQFHLDARMIPLTVHIAQQGSLADAKTLHLEVVDQEQVTPSAVMVSVYQGLMESNHYAAETTYRIRAQVRLKGYPEVQLENLIAPSDLAPASLMAAVVLGQSFTKLYENAGRRTPIEGIAVDVEAIPGRRTVEIQQATIDRNEAKAGSTISVQVTLQPWHGEVKNVLIPITLPANLPSGKVRLLVSDGATLDRILQPPQMGGPGLDVTATIAQLNAQHASDRLYVTLLAPDPQIGMEGRTLTAVPLSLANALEPGHDHHSVSLNGESAIPLASLPVDAVLNGQQVIAIRVE
nr:SpoIVB peptidase S55 domain-containing protein [Silvibacterium dinghuense]